MADTFSNDLRNSVLAIKRFEPIICQMLKGNIIMPVEGSEDEICKMLDMTCGIDYFSVETKTGRALSVGSRVQWHEESYDTFTIRGGRESKTKTEYDKRKYAIEHNGTYPYLTMQIFINKFTNELINIGIARTTDVINFIDEKIKEGEEEKIKGYTKKDKKGQSWFYIIAWEEFAKKNKLITYKPVGS